MIWTIVAFLAVLGTKLATQVRLKGLKAKLDAIQPHIDEVRVNLREAEEEYETLKLKAEDGEARLTHLRDAVNTLENSLKQPAAVNAFADERARQSEELAQPAEAAEA